MENNQIKEILGTLHRPLSSIKPREVIPTKIKEIDDYLIGVGGLPRGQGVEVSSLSPHSGKTTLCLNFAKVIQDMGGVVFWYNVGEGLDINYAKQIGIDADKLIVPPFTSAEDAFYQVKLLLAYDIPDLIVFDTVAVMTPDRVQDREDEGKNQFENFALAKAVCTFGSDLQGGFKIKDPNTGKTVPSPITYTKISNGKIEIEKNLHKFEDKKASIILINREKESKTAYSHKTTSPGGTDKENFIALKFLVSADKGDFGTEAGNPVLKYRTMTIECTKNKAGGVPFRKAKLLMMPDGKLLSPDMQPTKKSKKKNQTEEE